MNELHAIINSIVEIINQFWYFWIFIWMFLESSFFPFPSEVIMIPAWYLVFQWKMNLFFVILFWILWSLWGSSLNYFLAKKLWRKFLLKITSKEKIFKLESFFKNHWHISTFTWRLIPWIRQYISFPAWLAKMNFLKFNIYTWLWAWIWIIILTMLWYYLWANEDLIKIYLKEITIWTIIFIWIIIGIYFFMNKNKNK